MSLWKSSAPSVNPVAAPPPGDYKNLSSDVGSAVNPDMEPGDRAANGVDALLANVNKVTGRTPSPAPKADAPADPEAAYNTYQATGAQADYSNLRRARQQQSSYNQDVYKWMDRNRSLEIRDPAGFNRLRQQKFPHYRAPRVYGTGNSAGSWASPPANRRVDAPGTTYKIDGRSATGSQVNALKGRAGMPQTAYPTNALRSATTTPSFTRKRRGFGMRGGRR